MDGHELRTALMNREIHRPDDQQVLNIVLAGRPPQISVVRSKGYRPACIGPQQTRRGRQERSTTAIDAH